MVWKSIKFTPLGLLSRHKINLRFWILSKLMKRLIMKNFLLLSILMVNVLSGFTQTKDSIEHISELKSVKVSGKRKKPIEIINERYASGLFYNMSRGRTYDLINNPPPKGINQSILEYCQSLVFNLNVYRTNDGYDVTSTRQGGSITAKGVVKVKLYLDEQETESSTFNFIHPDDVALIKYFPPGQSQVSFNQGMGVLVIYTKKGEDLNPPSKFKKGELETIYKSINDTTIKL